MATTTPRTWTGTPTLTPEKIEQIVEEYRSNLADSDKADGDTIDFYEGAVEALEHVLDLLFEQPVTPAVDVSQSDDPNVVTLHIGISRDQDNTDLIAAIRSNPKVVAVFNEGDSWEVWGEPDTEADNGHLIIEVKAEDREKSQAIAEELGRTHGHVISRDRFAVTWVVSDAVAWSEDQVSGNAAA